MGRTLRHGDDAAANRAATHMMLINEWTPAETQEHLDEAFSTWRQRNTLTWAGTDLAWLRDHLGIEAAL